MPAQNKRSKTSLSPFTEIASQESIEHLNSPYIHSRTTSYIGLAIVLAILMYLATHTAWSGDIGIQVTLEFMASIIAITIASMSLIKFYTRNKRMYLLIGVGFLGAAFFDWLQALTTNVASVGAHAQSPYFLLHEWTVSRGFLALFFLASYLVWRLKRHYTVSFPLLYAGSGIVALAVGAFLFLYPPAQAKWVEIGILVLFISVLAGYLKKGYWKWKYFEHWLVMAIFVSIAAEIARLLSVVPYDQLFITAYIFKILSYYFAMLGLLMSMYSAFMEVEESRDRIDVILKSIGEGVFVTDLTGTIILMNKSAERLSGIPVDSALKKYYSDVFKFYYETEDKKLFANFVEKVLKSGALSESYSRITLKKNNGIHTPVSLSTAPVKSQVGMVFGCIVVFHDIRKERELEKTKDSFLSVAAHQLRAPLGSMRWNMELMLSGDLGKISGEMKERIEQLHENNQHMIGIVNDLLDVSGTDTDRVADQPKSTNIAAIIRNVVQELEGEAYAHHIKIAIQPKLAEVSNITIDPRRVHEVFENLISNAIKYNRNGGSVNVEIKEDDDAIHVAVSDTGVGIPKEDQTHLFSKYYRAVNVRGGAAEGSGLGLFVVKSYIEGWGGTIAFKSTEGKGTTFDVSIPKNPMHHALDNEPSGQKRTKKTKK